MYRIQNHDAKAVDSATKAVIPLQKCSTISNNIEVRGTGLNKENHKNKSIGDNILSAGAT